MKKKTTRESKLTLTERTVLKSLRASKCSLRADEISDDAMISERAVQRALDSLCREGFARTSWDDYVAIDTSDDAYGVELLEEREHEYDDSDFPSLVDEISASIRRL